MWPGLTSSVGPTPVNSGTRSCGKVDSAILWERILILVLVNLVVRAVRLRCLLLLVSFFLPELLMTFSYPSLRRNAGLLGLASCPGVLRSPRNRPKNASFPVARAFKVMTTFLAYTPLCH